MLSFSLIDLRLFAEAILKSRYTIMPETRQENPRSLTSRVSCRHVVKGHKSDQT